MNPKLNPRNKPKTTDSSKRNLKIIGGFLFLFIAIVALYSIGIIPLASFYDTAYGQTITTEITIDNTGGPAISNYPYLITVAHLNNMQDDYDDVMFSYENETVIPHYKDIYDPGNYANFYITPDIPADSILTIRMYHGNPLMLDSSVDASEMFSSYESFSSINGSLWSASWASLGSTSVTDGKMIVDSTTGAQSFGTIAQYNSPISIEFYTKIQDTTASYNIGFDERYIDGTSTVAPDYLAFTNNSSEAFIACTDDITTFVEDPLPYHPNEYNLYRIDWFSDSLARLYINNQLKATLETNLPDDPCSYGIWSEGDNIITTDFIRTYPLLANPPTYEFGDSYNEDGNLIVPYFIEPASLYVTIPVTVNKGEVKELYLKHEPGYAPSGYDVYGYFEGFDGEEVDPNNLIVAGEVELSNGYITLNESDFILGTHCPNNADVRRYVEARGTTTDGKVAFCGLFDNIMSPNTYVYAGDFGSATTLYVKGRNDAEGDTLTEDITASNMRSGTFYKYGIINHGIDEVTVKQAWTLHSTQYTGNHPYPAPTDIIYPGARILEGTPEMTLDYLRVRQYRYPDPPTISITEMGSCDKLTINNNRANAVNVTNYEISMNPDAFIIQSEEDSLLITDVYTPTLKRDFFQYEEVAVNQDNLLRAEFWDFLDSVDAYLITPGGGTEIVNLEYVGDKKWEATMNYSTSGSCTVTKYKVNGNKTILTSESFTIPAPASSGGGGGGGGGTYITPEEPEPEIEETEPPEATETPTEEIITENTSNFNWWWLILLLVLAFIGYEYYKHYKKNKR